MDKLWQTGECLVPGRTPCDPRDLVAHETRYRWAKQFCEGKEVVDAACGAGYGTAILAEVAAHVHGIDANPLAIEYAWANYWIENTGFEVRDVYSLSHIKPPIDVVVSFETIEHLRMPQRFLRQIDLKLITGGLLILSAPEGSTSAWHVWDFDREELQKLIISQFGSVAIRYFCQNFGDQILENGTFEYSAQEPRTHLFVVEKLC